MKLNSWAGTWVGVVALCLGILALGCGKRERVNAGKKNAGSGDLKEEIVSYLSQKSGVKVFAPGIRTEEALSNQDDDYIDAVREQVATVRSYEALYQLVGEQLATADRLLADTNVARRRVGLKLAREACGHVSGGDVDVWLAARICEAYFWPNLDLADAGSKPGSHEGSLELLETARQVFFRTDETNGVRKNFALLMERAPNAQAADQFRVQLADWLEEKGAVREAATVLAEVKDGEVMAAARERIARVNASVNR